MVLTFVALFATQSESALMVYHMPRKARIHPLPTIAPPKLERLNDVLPFNGPFSKRFSMIWSKYLRYLQQDVDKWNKLTLHSWLRQGRRITRFYEAYG